MQCMYKRIKNGETICILDMTYCLANDNNIINCHHAKYVKIYCPECLQTEYCKPYKEQLIKVPTDRFICPSCGYETEDIEKILQDYQPTIDYLVNRK